MAGFTPIPGVGAGFLLFQQADNISGIYADAAARDAYFSVNQPEVDRVALDEFLIIKLLDDGGGQIAYQQYLGPTGSYSAANWNDVTSLVQGETGPAGATGNSYFFSSVTARDDFFNIVGNEVLLETGLPIAVNVGIDALNSNSVTLFEWGGATSPPSYDSTLWINPDFRSGTGAYLFGNSHAMVATGENIIFKNTISDVNFHPVWQTTADGNTSTVRRRTTIAPVIFSDKTADLTNPVWDNGPSFASLTVQSIKVDFVNAPTGLIVELILDPAGTPVSFFKRNFGAFGTGEQTVVVDPPVDILLNQVIQFVVTDSSGADVVLKGNMGTGVPFQELQAATYVDDINVANNDDVVTLKPAASLGSAGYILNDFTDVEGYQLQVVDTGGSDPTIKEMAPFGKALLFNGSPAITVTDINNDYNHAFANTGMSGFSISKVSMQTDIFYEVFGLGDNAAANNEAIRIGWDNVEGDYHLETTALGTGLQRPLRVNTSNLILDNTSLRTDFTNLELLVTDTTSWSSPTKIIIHDKTVFGFGSGNNVTAHDITDINNIKFLQSQTFRSLYAIQAYVVSPDNSQQTRVNSTDSQVVIGMTISIAGGTYNGDHVVVRTDPLGNFFDIDVVFVDSPVGSLLEAILFGDYAAVRLHGNHIYAVDNDNNFYIYRIDSDTLFPVGAITSSSQMTLSRDVVINGNYAYWISADSSPLIGFAVVDITDKTRPVIVNTVDNSQRFFKGNLKDNVLFVTSAANLFGFKTYDITDPVNPVLLGTSTQHGLNQSAVEIKGNVAYTIAFNEAIIISTDISDPTNLVELDTLSFTGFPNNLIQFGNFMVAIDSTDPFINVVDISDPTTLVNTVEVSTSPFTSVGQPHVLGDRMFLPTTVASGLLVYSLRGINSHSAIIEDIEAERVIINNQLTANRLSVNGPAVIGGPVNFLSTGGIQGRDLFGVQNDVVYASSVSDFPAADTGVITLEPNTIYICYNDKPDFQDTNIFVFSDRIEFPDTGQSRIISENPGSVLLQYSGTGTFLTSNSTFSGIATLERLLISAPLGTVFSMDGVAPTPGVFGSRFFMENVGIFSFSTLGNVTTLTLNLQSVNFVGGAGGASKGLTAESLEELILTDVRFQNWTNTADTVFISVNGTTGAFRISGLIAKTDTNHAVFNLSPTLPSTVETLITSSEHIGTGEVFKTQSSNAIDFVTSDAADSGTVTSVANNGGNAEFTGVGFGLVSFQEVTMSGFSESTYNGTFFAFSPTGTTFELIDKLGGTRVSFVATDSGSYTAVGTLLSTSNTTGLSNGVPVNILGTVNNDGGFTTAGLIANTSFVINDGFTSASAPTLATWNTGSITNIDPRIQSAANFGIPLSKAISSVTAINVSMEATVIATQNVFIPLFLEVGGTGQARELEGMSRWTLVDLTTALVRYDGLDDFSGTLVCTMSVQAASSTPTFGFRVFKNGSEHVGGIVSDVALSSTSIGNVTLIVPITAVSGDTFLVEVENGTGTQNVTITHYTCLIQ